MSPSKTFNIAGLQCGYAVIRNPELRKRWKECGYGIVPPGNIMGNVAAYAALTQGREWLEQALAYLRENRDYLCQYVRGKMPPIRICSVEATYLAWLDCGSIDLGEGEKPSEFFLKNASVALNDGDEFGKGGSGFVRLNFACPRKILTRALEQMKNALENR
jgi:cystathionine beta-lyase